MHVCVCVCVCVFVYVHVYTYMYTHKMAYGLLILNNMKFVYKPFLLYRMIKWW